MKKFGILALILILSISMTACGNKTVDENDSTDLSNKNWAVNDVSEQTDKDVDIDDDGGLYYSDEEETETKDIPTIEHRVYSYNVDEDPKAKDVEKFDKISIDGKLMSFPCTYDDVKKNFNFLYEIVSNRYVQDKLELDPEMEAFNVEAHADGESGLGKITFYFKSADDNGSKLKDMICYKVAINAETFNNEKLMTLGLPHNITFGSSYEDIFELYQTYKIDSNMSDDETGWTYKIKTDDGIYVSFIGIDNGLNSVIIEKS